MINITMSKTVILQLNFYTGSSPQNVMINFIKLLKYTDSTIQTFQDKRRYFSILCNNLGFYFNVLV